MFEKFCDYMYYLLTSPFKKIKKSKNQWYKLFKVLGEYFDDGMESIEKAREQTMLATCDVEMLPVHAADGSKIVDAYEHTIIIGFDLHYLDGTWTLDGKIFLDGIENQEVE